MFSEWFGTIIFLSFDCKMEKSHNNYYKDPHVFIMGKYQQQKLKEERLPEDIDNIIEFRHLFFIEKGEILSGCFEI